MSMKKSWITSAHKGFVDGTLKENSLAAFARAADRGFGMELDVRLSKDGKVFVSVRNTGAGIAQQELPRLFDRFYKTDKSRSLDKTGVGLGLYIVQTIVNQHKGDLLVKSVEGEYTEFTFSVPAAAKKAIKEKNKRRIQEETDKNQKNS